MDQYHPKKKIKGITVSSHQVHPKNTLQHSTKPIITENKPINYHHTNISLPNKYTLMPNTHKIKNFDDSKSTRLPYNQEINSSFNGKESTHYNFVQPYKNISFPSYNYQRVSKSPIIYNNTPKNPSFRLESSEKQNSYNYSSYNAPYTSINKTEPIRNTSLQIVNNNDKFNIDSGDFNRYRSITKVQSIKKLQFAEFMRHDRKISAGNKNIDQDYDKKSILSNSIKRNNLQRSLEHSVDNKRSFNNDNIPHSVQIIKEQKFHSYVNDYGRSRLKFYKNALQEQTNHQNIISEKPDTGQIKAPINLKMPLETEKIQKQLQEKIQESRKKEDKKLNEDVYYFKDPINILEDSKKKSQLYKSLEDQHSKSPYCLLKQKNPRQSIQYGLLQEKLKEKDETIQKQASEIKKLSKILEQYSSKILSKDKQVYSARTETGSQYKNLIAELKNRIATVQEENTTIKTALNQQSSARKSLQNQHYSCQRNKLMYQEQLQAVKQELFQRQRQISQIKYELQMKVDKLTAQLADEKQMCFSLKNQYQKNKQQQASQNKEINYYKEIISKLVQQKDQLATRLDSYKDKQQVSIIKANNQDASLSLENKSLKQQNQFIKQQLIKAKNSLSENIALKKELANAKQDRNHLKIILTQTQSQYSKSQKEAQYYQLQLNSANKQLQKLQNENNELRLTSYDTIKQNGAKLSQVQKQNNQLLIQLELCRRNQDANSKLTNSEHGNMKAMSPTSKSKLQAELFYLRRKNQDLTKELINVNKKMNVMTQSHQENLRSLSPTKVTKVSANFTLEQMKTTFETYQNKSLQLSQRLHAKQNSEDKLKDRIAQLENEKRQLKEKLQIIQKKERSLEDSKKYSSQFSKYQLEQLNEKFEKTVMELNESLKRKNRDILQKDNFITSFLLSKIKPQSEVANIIDQIKRYFQKSQTG